MHHLAGACCGNICSHRSSCAGLSGAHTAQTRWGFVAKEDRRGPRVARQNTQGPSITPHLGRT